MSAFRQLCPAPFCSVKRLSLAGSPISTADKLQAIERSGQSLSLTGGCLAGAKGIDSLTYYQWLLVFCIQSTDCMPHIVGWHF
ncbi:hypothetical protein [Arachidicoccus terrestris]|uniref:hypothetical protein n=1 Tax=Arachidicoccus terrestris TaxID=2875539 RepID=UPI001CC4A2CF|nr:hypothetical protein [Arachidicoccus terrestris]UAY56745.1 hypothetical protein K9M52_07060 [Arachidicoccus terrestris]